MRLKPLWFLLAAALLLAACRQTPPEMSLALTATVGTDADVCADTSELTLTETDPVTVYFCYTIENTGVVPISLHDLSDDLFGAILRDFEFELAPGASVSTVDAGLELASVVSETTTNAAVWDGFLRDRRVATAEAESTVTFVPTAQYWAAGGTAVGDSNNSTIGSFSGNILFLGAVGFDQEPLEEPFEVSIDVPGVGTFPYVFDPEAAVDGVVAIILADFESGPALGSLGALGMPLEFLHAPSGDAIRPSATVGGDFVIAFPNQTLVVAIDPERSLTVPVVTDTTFNAELDEATVSFVDDDPGAMYRVEVFGRGFGAFNGVSDGDASPIVVELAAPLGADEAYVVDVLAVLGELEPFGPPAQIDVAAYLHYSE